MEDSNINDIVNKLKTILQSNTSNSFENVPPDSNISKEMLENLLHQFNQGSQNNSDSSSGIDLDTVLKMQKIMKTLNMNDDPRTKLLYSLKPYLRESRKKKIDQYANLFKLTSITDLFKNEKGDGN